MSLQKEDDWKAEYERERQVSINRMINSRCVYCRIKCKDMSDYTMGETYKNEWYCFEHTEQLFNMLKVSNTSEFWDNNGSHR